MYSNLGAVYLELERPKSDARMCIGERDHGCVTWSTSCRFNRPCQNLSKAYGTMGSYTVALEVRQRVIDAWESRGPTAHDEMREARRLLEQLKEKAQGLSCSGEDEVFPRKALPLPLNSECAP